MQIRDVFNWGLDQSAWWLFGYWIAAFIFTLIAVVERLTR